MIQSGMKIMELVKKVLAGDSGALGRLITAVEDDLVESSEVMNKIHGHLGHSYIIGVTGPQE